MENSFDSDRFPYETMSSYYSDSSDNYSTNGCPDDADQPRSYHSLSGLEASSASSEELSPNTDADAELDENFMLEQSLSESEALLGENWSAAESASADSRSEEYHEDEIEDKSATPLYDGSGVTVTEAMLLLLQYSLRFVVAVS